MSRGWVRGDYTASFFATLPNLELSQLSDQKSTKFYHDFIQLFGQLTNC